MRLSVFVLLLSGTLAHAESVRLPSFVSVSGALGNESYKDSSLLLGLTLPYNFQLELGGERTVTTAGTDEGDINIKAGHVAVQTDPERLFSLRLSGESWSIPNSVQASGGRVGLTFAPGAWSFTLEYAKQTMALSDLPILVSRSGETEVNDEGYSARISTSIVRHWNFYVSGSSHSYDKDIDRLDELPTITLSRMPASVMTSLLGLNKNDAALGATYFFRKWDLGFEAGRSVSAVDDAKTRRLGILATYYFNGPWSIGLNSFAFRPEVSEESTSPGHSTSLTVTYKW